MERTAQAAIVEEANGAISIETITIEDPGPGEVLVRLVASGVCHSDWWAIENGNWSPTPWPFYLGHEGAGIVEQVGEGVADLEPGARVVLSWAVPCGRCGPCRRGTPRRCGHELTQPPRMHRTGDDAALTGVLNCGTLGTYTVVTAPQAIRMPDEIPLARACLLGCGVSTGVGAAIQTAGVHPGASVAVIGLGGIGLGALQGAVIAGAERVIAIDVAPAKLDWASRFGATDLIDASKEDPVELVRSMTGTGVDYAFEAVGRPECVSQAVAMLDYAGTAVAIGVPPIPSQVSLDWNGTDRSAYPRKTSLLICDGGDPIPAEDFPQMARWYEEGRLDLDAMVTRETTLDADSLDEAFRAMLAGEVIRTVVVIDEDQAR